ncbi:uncharacterized protein LOC133742965 [Rosa rugosa]|uniref:uncharacterized protein LOC133742965 n=1 Tax=Rosa rugosa TaxID=74645 RepID=UPI002B40FEF0|nr:uncharacterized protein LOC133742965 [Rosa rugosa]
MPNSHISRLGQGFKNLQNLKSLSFESCKFLIEVPDLSGMFPNLDMLNLSFCTEIVGRMESLTTMKVGQTAIKELPSSIGSSLIFNLCLYSHAKTLQIFHSAFMSCKSYGVLDSQVAQNWCYLHFRRRWNTVKCQLQRPAQRFHITARQLHQKEKVIVTVVVVMMMIKVI